MSSVHITRAGRLTVWHGPGPGPLDTEAFGDWLARGCSGSLPDRRGFAALLERLDGSVVAACSSRLEQDLHYALTDGALVVAGHVRDLIQRLPEPPELDVVRLAGLLVLHDHHRETVYRGVLRLPIGHHLTWRPGQALPEPRRWFRPDEQDRLDLRPGVAAGLMREEVVAAVEASLPDDGDVAASLSGGLDSSTVVGIAARVVGGRGDRVHCLTHVPLPGTADPSAQWLASDGPDAERMAAGLPCATWSPLVNTAGVTPLQAVREVLPLTWGPVLNPSNTVWFAAMTRAADASGATALLTGATGNAPYSRSSAGLAQELVREEGWLALAGEVRRRRAAGDSLRAAARQLVIDLDPPLARAAYRSLTRRGPRDVFVDTVPVRRDVVSPESLASLSHRLEKRFDVRRRWVDFVLRDGSTALVGQHSMTGWWTDALSDPGVEELALRLPVRAWLESGIDRGLAREAARGIVPDHIRLRHTRGSQAADVGRWMAGHEQDYRDVLDQIAASPAGSQFVDVEMLRAELDRGLPTGPAAQRWNHSWGRAIGFGQFAVWYESEVLTRGPGARPDQPPR